jgi:putative transcriptional regulator
MPAKRKINTRLTGELLETAKDMHASGVMSDAAYEKITMRHFEGGSKTKRPLTADDIRALRTKAHMSQAVFANLLNVTTGYVSQLERGTKRPTGAALVLLNVIREKGIATIM